MNNFLLDLTLGSGEIPLISDPENYTKIDVEAQSSFFLFNGGEPHLRLIPPDAVTADDRVLVATRIQTMNDFGFVAVAISALQHMGMHNIDLLVPYLPGARQDRVAVEGEPLTLEVYMDLLGALNATRIFVLDPHSPAYQSHEPKLIAITPMNFYDRVVSELMSAGHNYICLVAPDAGAVETVALAQMGLSARHGVEFAMAKASKIREPKTGKLSGFELLDEVPDGYHAVILDDICDGGGTFVGLRNEFPEGIPVSLAVTHGIFSRGMSDICEHFDHVFTSESWVVDPFLGVVPENLKHLAAINPSDLAPALPSH